MPHSLSSTRTKGRLETAAHGGSNPVAANETPEGKQQNRHVELVKLEGSR